MELYEKYKIEDKVRKYVLETVYTGDCFVAVLNYQKEFKKVLAENTNITETEMFKSVVSESVNGLLNECETYVTEKPFFKTSYERYDWLMKYGCTNSDDRLWLQEYQKTEVNE